MSKQFIFTQDVIDPEDFEAEAIHVHHAARFQLSGGIVLWPTNLRTRDITMTIDKTVQFSTLRFAFHATNTTDPMMKLRARTSASIWLGGNRPFQGVGLLTTTKPGSGCRWRRRSDIAGGGGIFAPSQSQAKKDGSGQSNKVSKYTALATERRSTLRPMC